MSLQAYMPRRGGSFSFNRHLPIGGKMLTFSSVKLLPLCAWNESVLQRDEWVVRNCLSLQIV